MPNKAKLLSREHTPNVGPVARLITRSNDVGKVPARISNLSAPDPRTHLIMILIQKHQNPTITQHRPIPSLHPRKTTQKTSFATTPIQPTCLSPTVHQVGSSNENIPRLSTSIDGLPLCCLATTDGKSYHYYL